MSTYMRNIDPMHNESIEDSIDQENPNKTCLDPESIAAILMKNETWPLDTELAKISFGFMYGLIWSMATLSNGLVVAVIVTTYVLGRRRRRKYAFSDSSFRRRRALDGQDRIILNPNSHPFSVQTVFVLSLACSDLLAAMVSLPITAITIFSGEWLFPRFMCSLISFLQALSIFQSSFTYTSIAIDRFVLVLYPNAQIFTYKSARASVVATLILSAILSFPMYLYNEVIDLESICISVCVERWPIENRLLSAPNYALFVAITVYGLPVLATTVCYMVIARRLRKRQEALHVDNHPRRRRGAEQDLSSSGYCTEPSSAFSARQSRIRSMGAGERRLTVRRRRTVRMMAAMVATFTILWFPFTLISLILDFDTDQSIFDGPTYKLLFTTGHLVAMSTLVWNPIIYAWFNRRIRNALKTFLRQLRCCQFIGRRFRI